MARLRQSTTTDEIIDVLCELGRGRRGGAEELAYLADHPDPDYATPSKASCGHIAGAKRGGYVTGYAQAIPATADRAPVPGACESSLTNASCMMGSIATSL